MTTKQPLDYRVGGICGVPAVCWTPPEALSQMLSELPGFRSLLLSFRPQSHIDDCLFGPGMSGHSGEQDRLSYPQGQPRGEDRGI